METIEQAITIVGSARKLALQIGVSAQAVSLWRKGRTHIHSGYAAAIEDATGGAVTAYEIGRECMEKHS